MPNIRDHRGKGSKPMPPPSSEGHTEGGFEGAHDHRGGPVTPTGPRPETSNESGGVLVTDTPSTPDLGKGAGGD